MKKNWDTPIEKISDTIMTNPHIMFKNRLVRCWNNPKLCPKYQKQGNYGNGICEGCH